jgi:hypothetical protein
VRTANADTPVAAAISACELPAACSSLICSVSSGVSLDGPFGPRLAGTSAATPPAASAFFHRHTVAGSPPHAAATSFTFAAPVAVSCTAASLRPASSPASQQNVTIPCTHTAPDPSSLDTRPTPRATSAAPSGSHGSGAWTSRAAMPPPRKNPPRILQ